MASYNPAMLSDTALPKDWKAAPDLTSFAASYSSNTTASISAPTAGTGSAPSSATPPSADPSTAAGLAATGNGAGGQSFIWYWIKLMNRSSWNFGWGCSIGWIRWDCLLVVLNVRVGGLETQCTDSDDECNICLYFACSIHLFVLLARSVSIR
jgi:hypothetical protein